MQGPKQRRAKRNTTLSAPFLGKDSTKFNKVQQLETYLLKLSVIKRHISQSQARSTFRPMTAWIDTSETTLWEDRHERMIVRRMVYRSMLS